MAQKPKKPVSLCRSQSSVVISWQDAITPSPSGYILQRKNELKEWTTIYRGGRSQYRVKDLAPCSYCDLRVKAEGGSGWLEFKAGTTDGPYLVMHMTRAVKFGKTPLIRKIAQSRPQLLEVENREMKTPLMQAVEIGDLAVVNLLINLGAPVNQGAFKTMRTPFMMAVYQNRLQIAALLVDKGCNVKATDINGLNALHYAVDSDEVENVKFAINLGLPIDGQDKNGWSPLLRAVILNCSTGIVEVLLENGADKNLKDKCGFDYKKHQELFRQFEGQQV